MTQRPVLSSARDSLAKATRRLAAVAALVLGGLTAFAQPYGLDQRPVVGPFLDGALPSTRQTSTDWQVVEAFPNLTFLDMTGLYAEPGTNRLYVIERHGTIYFFENTQAVTNKTLFLDLSPVTLVVEDSGLLGMAFHPEYGMSGSSNRNYIYVSYQFIPEPDEDPNLSTIGYNRLSRFTVPDGSLVVDTNSELVLINQLDRHTWHNGGGMFFGPDGFLYLSNGDEGGASDAYSQSQRIDSGLFGGVLRIDVDMNPLTSHPIRRQPQSGTSPPGGWPPSYSSNYFIPNDNPWIDTNGLWLEEFYCIGLRSPHRLTYDAVTDRMWAGDVGQASREEVDVIHMGANYQWPYMEGNINGPKATPNPLIGSNTPPVYDYERSEGNAVIGGYVYRGTEHAASLEGKYIFGDNGSGSIWAMEYDGVNQPTVTFLANMPAGELYTGLSSFGVDQNNELYMCKMGSGAKVYKLSQGGVLGDAPPPLLSQIGAFTNLLTLAPSSALLPYAVASPLWSDASDKSRWMVVPTDGAPYGADETIGFSTNGNWQWPTGSVLVKHFNLATNETNASQIKRLETRFLSHGTNGIWYGLTYKWRADNTDADLLNNSLNETNLITTATGVRTQVWYYPSQQDCQTCHNLNANQVLGPRTCQLNGDASYPSTGNTDNQLRTLNHIGLFNNFPGETNIASMPQAVPLDHPSASLELKVRSYLDSNCAHCHRPDGVRANFDARFDTPMEQQNIINGPVESSLGIVDARVVAPMSLSQSIMHLRMTSTLPSLQMPPLARNLIDETAVAVLADWINSLPISLNLPSPWLHQDVGPVGVPGDASHTNATFTVEASGVDIWDNEDSFHFVHRPLIGDAVITARVTSLSNTDPWALAGVIIRESLDEDSKHVIAGITYQNGTGMTRRTTTGDSSLYTAGTGASTPHWIRLERVGDSLTGYDSPDGTNWTEIGSHTVVLPGSVYVGLAYTSHDNATLGSATFDEVLVIGPNVNNAPTAMPDALQRYSSQGLTTPASLLLTNDTDVDGDALILNNVESPSPLGATVTLSNNTVYYWPPFANTNADTFDYVISDGGGGTATGSVTVSVLADPPVIEVLAIQTSANDLTLNFTGVPHFTYTVQYTDSLDPPSWQNLHIVTADELGQIQSIDNSPTNGPARFYRAVRGIAPSP